MASMDKEKLKIYLSYYNRNTKVLHQGMEYKFSEEDFKYLNRLSNYWHNEKSPSSWLCSFAVNHAKVKFGKYLPREKLIKLCADTLNITADKLESTLNWNANYIAWHDGGKPEDHHVYPDKRE